MTAPRISTAAKIAALQAIQDKVDAGAGAGVLEIYTGSPPATVEGAITTQVLLGTLLLSDPCAAAATGVLTFAPIAQDNSADASGTASWFRICDSNGVPVIDGSVSDNAGTGLLKLNTVEIVAGGPILVSSGSLSLG